MKDGQPYGKVIAKQLIQTAVDERTVIWTSHAKEQMGKRGFDAQDVTRALRGGLIHNAPEQHIKTGRWNYRVESKTLDNAKIKVVVDILDNGDISIITVLDK